MPKISKLARIELTFENDVMTGAQVVYADAFVDGNQTYPLAPRTESLVNAADSPDVGMQIKDILGDALVAANRTAAQAETDKVAAAAQVEARDTQMTDLITQAKAADAAAQQLARERDEVQANFDKLGQDAQDLRKQITDLTNQRDQAQAELERQRSEAQGLKAAHESLQKQLDTAAAKADAPKDERASTDKQW